MVFRAIALPFMILLADLYVIGKRQMVWHHRDHETNLLKYLNIFSSRIMAVGVIPESIFVVVKYYCLLFSHATHVR